MPAAVAVVSSRRQPARQRGERALTRVNALRIERGLTVRQLATRSQLGVRTIERLMAGTPCTLGAYRRVARALDVDPFILWPHLMTNPDMQDAIDLARASRR